MPLTPVLTKRWLSPRSWTLETYEKLEGYQGLRKALGVHPDEIIQLVKDSGLRGRGGAGFPTGMKWGFIPQNDGKPHYVVVNADEGEPGTCRDAPLMMADPHSLIEGIAIASYAVRCNTALIYLRGELVHCLRRLQHAVREAYRAGYLGRDILGSGFDLDLVVHSGAGAYICGEETALLDSLEGYRGHQLKFWTPGGSSTPLLTAEHLDVPLDFDSVTQAGSMNGTSALQVFDDSDSVVYAVYKWTTFYAHESCGKCTPCREGTYWMVQVLARILSGQGTAEDLDTLLDTADNINGRSFCALGDGATSPITSSLKYFRQEYEDYIEGRIPPR